MFVSILQEKQATTKSRGPLLAVLKWVATVGMAALLLVCLVVAKLSALVLSSHVYTEKKNLKDTDDKVRLFPLPLLLLLLCVCVRACVCVCVCVCWLVGWLVERGLCLCLSVW